MTETFGPDYVPASNGPCPNCPCCSAALCEHSQEVGWGCEHHAEDDEQRQALKTCPCSAYYEGPVTLTESGGETMTLTVFIHAAPRDDHSRMWAGITTTLPGEELPVLAEPFTQPCTLTWPGGQTATVTLAQEDEALAFNGAGPAPWWPPR
ncbi:hypothetical protein [Streptomyces sp. NPDC059883]|uniref:hypothetical protein n=1 Tax=unclassified Streptomyces TaxID=2593676 RepID=UPI003658667D